MKFNETKLLTSTILNYENYWNNHGRKLVSSSIIN